MDAGRVLREARRRAHLTQRGLAAKARVPQSMIARIESGAVMPRVDTLDSLLESCGEGLYTTERVGFGVDATLAEDMLAVSPTRRLFVARESAKNIYRDTYSTRRKAGFAAEGGPEEPTQIAPIIDVLLRNEVRFIVIGGVAANLRGSPSLTFDFDICYERSDPNIERLLQALNDLAATLRGVPPGLPNVLDRKYLANAINITLNTRFGALDCLGEPAGTSGYGSLLPNSTDEEVGGFMARVVSISDLIRMKAAAGRRKDLKEIEELGAIQEMLDRRAREGRTAKRERPSRD